MKIFRSKTALKGMLINCYRKFKSRIYYSNNLEHIKLKISAFEKSQINMDGIFDKLALALQNDDSVYFSKLVKSVKYRIYPKSFDKGKSEALVVSNNCESQKVVVTKVNFFIDAPIEIYILDTFWTLIIGKIFYDEDDFSALCANIIDPDVYIDGKKNLLPSIDFKSLTIFSPYFSQYKKWKKGAVRAIDRLYEAGKDSTLISLDLKRYYYSADIDFNELENYLVSKSKEYKKFIFLHGLIASLYKEYSHKIAAFDSLIGKKQIIIPIGLTSSGVLANYYLKDFDDSIKNQINIEYYSRYVDDIIIVLNIAKNEDFNTKDILLSLFPEDFSQELNVFKLTKKKNIFIQNDKIKLIKTFHDGPKTYIDILKEELKSASEPQLMPDFKVDLKGFLSEVNCVKDEAIKFRDVESVTVDSKTVMSFISSYLSTRKNVVSDFVYAIENDRKKAKRENKYAIIDSKIIEQMQKFFCIDTLFQLFARWNKIFLFSFLINRSSELEISIFDSINSGITGLSLNLDSNYKAKKIHQMQTNIIESLQMLLQIAIASSFAIRFDTKLFKKFVPYEKIKRIAINLRKSNMIDNTCVGFPLANYFTEEIKDYYKIDLTSIGKMCPVFDPLKIKYSPCFIHFSDFCIVENVACIDSINQITFLPQLIKKYEKLTKDIAHTSFFDMKVNSKKDSTYYQHANVKLDTNSSKTELSDIKIAMANMNLENHPVVRVNKKTQKKYINFDYYTSENKEELYSLLNNSFFNEKNYHWYLRKDHDQTVIFAETKNVQKPVDFIVFPEVSVPFLWIPLLEKFSRKSGITVVCGLKHIKIRNRVYNLQATIVPYIDRRNHRNSLVLLREKNDYSPEEKEIIKNNHHLSYEERPKSFYYAVDWNNIKFTSFICYELTDIHARSLMRRKVDLIFACENNADIQYFSNIIESTARDLSCYVVQCNSSAFGDTRILGPFRRIYMTVASISGGEKSTIHIGKINLTELHDFFTEYRKTNITNDYSSLKNKPFDKYKKPSARHIPVKK